MTGIFQYASIGFLLHLREFNFFISMHPRKYINMIVRPLHGTPPDFRVISEEEVELAFFPR